MLTAQTHCTWFAPFDYKVILMYGLRKVNNNLKHYDFTWDLTIGAVNTAPDWNSNTECGNGLHLLPNAQGHYGSLRGDYWVVVEFDETKMVMIDSNKAKVKSCVVRHVSKTTQGLFEFFKDVKFDSRSAYSWARLVGNAEYMRQFVTEPQWAYYWANAIGDVEYMRQFVTAPQWAYWWTRFIGDDKYMSQFFTDAEWYYHRQKLPT